MSTKVVQYDDLQKHDHHRVLCVPSHRESLKGMRIFCDACEEDILVIQSGTSLVPNAGMTTPDPATSTPAAPSPSTPTASTVPGVRTTFPIGAGVVITQGIKPQYFAGCTAKVLEVKSARRVRIQIDPECMKREPRIGTKIGPSGSVYLDPAVLKVLAP